jgi:hypothetical protein
MPSRAAARARHRAVPPAAKSFCAIAARGASSEAAPRCQDTPAALRPPRIVPRSPSVAPLAPPHPHARRRTRASRRSSSAARPSPCRATATSARASRRRIGTQPRRRAARAPPARAAARAIAAPAPAFVIFCPYCVSLSPTEACIRAAILVFARRKRRGYGTGGARFPPSFAAALRRARSFVRCAAQMKCQDWKLLLAVADVPVRMALPRKRSSRGR